MSGSLNRATIIGHLGNDPESRSLNNGGKVVSMSIATSEQWKDKGSGEKRERTEWHRVVIFNEQLGEVAAKYLKKGSKALIEGQIQTRKWQDNAGVDRYSTEIVLQGFDAKLVLLDRVQSDPGRHDYSSHARDGFGGGTGGASSGAHSDLDDDVPF
jgi:single-strand DNA-binding protein